MRGKPKAKKGTEPRSSPLSPQASGCNVPRINPGSWSLSALCSIHYLSEIFKTQTKGKTQKKMPKIITELPSAQHSLWDCPTEGRLPKKVLRKRRSGSHPRSFCFELGPPCLLCQGPKPVLIIRLGDLSSRPGAYALAAAEAGWRGRCHWDCLTTYNFPVWGLGKS